MLLFVMLQIEFNKFFPFVVAGSLPKYNRNPGRRWAIVSSKMRLDLGRNRVGRGRPYFPILLQVSWFLPGRFGKRKNVSCRENRCLEVLRVRLENRVKGMEKSFFFFFLESA